MGGQELRRNEPSAQIDRAGAAVDDGGGGAVEIEFELGFCRAELERAGSELSSLRQELGVRTAMVTKLEAEVQRQDGEIQRYTMWHTHTHRTYTHTATFTHKHSHTHVRARTQV